uniref:Putative manganese transport system permease protein n=1 Tax=uncultured marine microorganism TaxID=415540 RepID=A5CFS1_9ZZZZ|nr:putative manganese transport system permease protein [uncultured marine microorganism]
MTNRWWIYQKERFPIIAHGPLIVVFCLAVMLFSALQQEQFVLPDIVRISGAVISTLILFFQLRVADEFKDFEIDLKYRPQRPVPRGLVQLQELATLAYLGAVIQFLIALFVDIGLLPILAAVWAYMALMTKEFFAPVWLRKHPAIYLFSHMLIMPLIAFYVSAFDWLCVCRAMPQGISWILSVAFFCGLVLELGRKIRIPRLEQEGVETYSALWGTGNSVAIWLVSIVAAVAAYANAAALITSSNLHIGLGAAALAIGILTLSLFPKQYDRGYPEFAAKIIEPSSGLVAMLLYLGLGPIQAILRLQGA